MDKYDIKREYRGLYTCSAEDFTEVQVPEFRYVAIDGVDDPNTAPAYTEAVEALYAVSYALKFASKTLLQRDFVVGPLEGQWWSDDMSAFVRGDKSSWEWRMMIAQPPWVTDEMVTEAVETAAKKAAAKGKPLPALPKLRPFRLTEGRCLQILHVGPYDDEAPVLERLHTQVMPERGLTFAGEHHEIYLNDPRRTEPAKLRTVLRQPVTPE
ncbi:GyrI-like domain-containing protein [Rhodococcus sp. Z13]|uniref:GyrI-like domain-containing protein n=1 Tax=Rhodococcus sacchari TaxID=2962047 RepID=A0ACD4DI14_9NOCA|nr:GyrI-like domain-containing protein [Rhodococcus sp. Z13]UYP19673.1 GyrI-like domain-containing protein [Rhodococcus sp. Z13]